MSNETSFPIAAALVERKAPFLFVTGHAEAFLPTEMKDKLLLSKPLDIDVLGENLETLLETEGGD